MWLPPNWFQGFRHGWFLFEVSWRQQGEFFVNNSDFFAAFGQRQNDRFWVCRFQPTTGIHAPSVGSGAECINHDEEIVVYMCCALVVRIWMQSNVSNRCKTWWGPYTHVSWGIRSLFCARQVSYRPSIILLVFINVIDFSLVSLCFDLSIFQILFINTGITHNSLVI